MKDLSEMGGFAAEAIKHDTVSFIAWHPDGRLLTANTQFYDLTGYSPEEAGSMRWPRDFACKALDDCIAGCMRDSGIGEKSCRCEGTILRKDRTQKPVSVFLHIYHPGHREEPHYYAFIADITKLKEQEKWLRLTQFAMDHFTDPSLWLDVEGRIRYANEAACRTLGYSREGLQGMMIWQVDRQQTPENFMKRWEYVRKAGHITFESLNVAEDGKQMLMEVHASYISYDDTERMICFAHDITERRRAEEALAESEEKFRVVSDTSLAAIFLVGENTFFYANPAGQKLMGYTAAELYKMNYWDVIGPEFREGMIEYGDRLLRGEAVPGRFVIKFVRKDGTDGWGDLSVAPVKYPNRKGMIGVITALDITERKQAEEALKESEEKFRVLSELSPLAIFLYQGDKLIYANPAAVAFTGYSMSELLSKNFWDMTHPDYREMVKMYGKARQKGEPVPARYEVKYIKKNGEEGWSEFTAGFIEYRGRPAGIVNAMDITERKLGEIALREAKSQAELYVDLMGHDINNMNMAARGFLELACDKLNSQGSLGKEDLHLINNAMDSLENSSNLIASVRKLQKERKGVLQPGHVCLHRVLAEVKERHSRVPGRDVTITYSAVCDCCVLANELLIDVFTNIVGNAIKHSTGPLAINISLLTAEEHETIYCKAIIEDTGPGIPDEQKEGIFERAGKEQAKLTGKGLGLYLVKTLIDDFKGRVWVEDRVPGDYRRGSRFVVMLPAAKADHSKKADEADICGI